MLNTNRNAAIGDCGQTEIRFEDVICFAVLCRKWITYSSFIAIVGFFSFAALGILMAYASKFWASVLLVVALSLYVSFFFWLPYLFRRYYQAALRHLVDLNLVECVPMLVNGLSLSDRTIRDEIWVKLENSCPADAYLFGASKRSKQQIFDGHCRVAVSWR